MIQMGQNNVPIIHLLNINKLLEKYGLPESPVPLPEPGEGKIFVEEKYNVLLTAIITLFLAIVIGVVYVTERRHHKLGTDIVPQTGLSSKGNQEPENALDL